MQDLDKNPSQTIEEYQNRIRRAKKGLSKEDKAAHQVPGFIKTIGDRTVQELAEEVSVEPAWFFDEWLKAKWLEHHVLHAVKIAGESTGVHQSVMNIMPGNLKKSGQKFEVDVIAIQGYRLFAFSIGTDTEKPKLKLKLFEAARRATQMGGDEARIALVCPYHSPETLEDELRSGWSGSPDQIRVFGKMHLTSLSDEFSEWFKKT